MTYNTTRFPTLFYANPGRKFWSFFVKNEGDTHYAQVGPQYSTKAELLGDLTRYAIEYGLEPYPVLREVAPGIYRAQKGQ
jgi:ribosome-interacting GTPase 1